LRQSNTFIVHRLITCLLIAESLAMRDSGGLVGVNRD
jgi:hypothetical protein